jgi:hypothetical protein
MKAGTAILIAAGTGLLISGVQYRRGIDRLEFSLNDILIGEGGTIGLEIVAHNPSHYFAYPVPELFLNVFDEDSNFLGSLRSDELQWIHSNGDSLIRAWLLPNYTELGTILVHLLLPTAMDVLKLNGIIKVGSISIPLDTELTVPANQGAAV